MNLLKTPHQKLMEEAGLAPASPGMLNTPHQLLMQEAGGTQHFDHGGQATMSPQDMLASLVASGHLPAHYAPGGSVQHYFKGSTVGNVGTNAALTLPFAGNELEEIGRDIGNKKYLPAALKAGVLGYSAFAPVTPLTALITGLTGSDPVGEGSTLDEYNQRKAEESARYKEHLRQTSPVFKRPTPMTAEEMQEEALGYPKFALPPVKPYPPR